MSVYSMTGYASAQFAGNLAANSPAPAQDSGRFLGLEIRCVNSRYLDLSFRLPDEMRAIEPALRELLQAQLKRGKVELRLSALTREAETIAEPSPRLLQRLNSLQDQILSWLPQATPLTVADVMRLGASENRQAPDWADAQVLELANQVLQELKTARAREGSRLASMLCDRILQIRNLVQQARPLIPVLVEQQRQRFLDRWQEAMALADSNAVTPVALQERALAEATAFAIRIDVAEELTRLNSHLDEIDRLLEKGGELGKRLDFLIQELHREANTLGSKSAALELTRISVDMKVLIEQMREQVQNIE